MTDQTPTDRENIRPVPLGEALSERYLAYAMSTIMSRSLPDVRDGLKPVHRRLLYAMRLLRLDPDAGFKKCARIVGDVMGKFHPHGDTAIYDALVRLAQDFAVRYPLIEGQGNFGNVDGDNAAAMRYTEARLTEIAERLLQGIDEDAVDFRPTYDGEEAEPVVLPAAFPNLLANGAVGIAVGMATNIPPHNATELCRALDKLIAKKSSTVADLMAHVQGPDFPTGGVIAEDPARIAEAYETGRGSLRVRAQWRREDAGRGGYRIVVTELPYQVQKGRLVEKIATLVTERKLPALADIRDESAEDMRLVLEPRARTVDADALMAQLFRLTDLELRFNFNMNALDGGRTPRVMSLKEMLQAFLDHRHEVLCRCSRHRLGVIADRLEVLGGYLAAFLNLDEVIAIIRNEDEPKPVLIKQFDLTDRQAKAILDMRLRQLRKLEEQEIRKEHAGLTEEQKKLEALLGDEKARWKVIRQEIAGLRKRLEADPDLGRRRTVFAAPPSAADVQAAEEILVEKEPLTVICSEKGWIRGAKGHIASDSELKFKEGDQGRFFIHAQTTDRILLLATDGRIFTLSCDRLPGGRGHGEPVRLMIDLPNEADIAELFVHGPGGKRLLASDAGRGFIVAEDDVLAATRNGKQALNLGAGEKAVIAAPVGGGADSVAVIGDNRKLLIFPLADLPEMSRGRGVRLQTYRQGGLRDAKCFSRADGLTWITPAGQVRREETPADWTGKRAGAGRAAPRGFNRSGDFDAR